MAKAPVKPNRVSSNKCSDFEGDFECVFDSRTIDLSLFLKCLQKSNNNPEGMMSARSGIGSKRVKLQFWIVCHK